MGTELVDDLCADDDQSVNSQDPEKCFQHRGPPFNANRRPSWADSPWAWRQQLTGSVLMPFVVEVFGHFRAAEDQPVEAQHDDQKPQHFHR